METTDCIELLCITYSLQLGEKVPVCAAEVGRLNVPHREQGHHCQSLVVVVGRQGGASTLTGGWEA